MSSNSNTIHTFVMTEAQAFLVHRVVDSHTQALKNWIASAVENDQPGRAKTLVTELREYQALFAEFNVTSKREWSEGMNEPMPTTHHVKSR